MSNSKNKPIQIDQNIIHKSIKHYGKTTQIVTSMEEMAELQQALSKSIRGKTNKDNIIEEVADVMICLDVIKNIFDINQKDIQEYVDKKQKRIVNRMSNK